MAKDRFPLGEEHQRAGLRPPQFGTVGLLGFMAAIAVVTAVFQVGGPLAAFVLSLLLLAVFAHVVGNAIGTKLRDEGSARTDERELAAPGSAESHHFAPATQLSHRKRLGLLTIIFTCCFAIAGATVGGMFLAHVNWESATFANLSLAVVSCGVLGGFWGFWICSFAKVAFQAWTEALRHESEDVVSSTPSLDKLLASQSTQTNEDAAS